MKEENKTTEEDNKVAKVSVRSMSKKVVIWLAVILIALSIYDIVKSSQNGTSSWIQRYLQTNYPIDEDGFVFSFSSELVENELSNADSDKQLQETSGTHEERQSETEVQNTTGAMDLGGAQNTANEEYLFAESATRLLTAADISNFQTRYPNSLFPGDRSITQMIINEMYAKHGYIFKDQALTDYFSQKSWYAPKTTDMEQIYPVMNDVEQANVTLLRTYS